ncbi:hypothetical protein L917_15486 [Phytophthora nicotianae]|uniref:Uncharacterized protein n=1 Tax=Phytophthora nicotianae TaxID=4792 RepID=W2G4Y5_PHYNI|nr:hypothetical protein L915_15784 [Phytophthora nicotianae]ETL84811.1 hypothetical protein L917_15486 [Phytophthora nicotianae]ETM37968.1 hypothetical protein L914_15627 [Phytophthora nicotianae]
MPNTQIKRKTRWPTEFIKFAEGVVEEHSCFCIEALVQAYKLGKK